MTMLRLVTVSLLFLIAGGCSKAYVSPDSGPRAKLAIVSQENRGTVGFMTPQECRDRIGAHPIFDLSAGTQMPEIYLRADQDTVLAYDYDQPEHLGPVGPLAHCHAALAFHPKDGENYVLEVSSANECALDLVGTDGKEVPGVKFAGGRCESLPASLTPGFPPHK